VRANDLTVEIFEQIRDGVDHLGTSVAERIDRLGDRVDHMETSLGERLDGTNHRLDRVEQGLLDLGKFMRQAARDRLATSASITNTSTFWRRTSTT
jgi:hypothetical protein